MKKTTNYSLTESVKPAPRRFQVPFWFAVAGPTVAFLLMASLIRFLVLLKQEGGSEKRTLDSFDRSKKAGSEQIRSMLATQEVLEYSAVLESITRHIKAYVIDRTDRAVDGLWNTMRSYRKFNMPVDGAQSAGGTEHSRWMLAFPMWSELSDVPESEEAKRSVDFLMVAFATEAFTAVSSRDPTGTRGCLWLEGPPLTGTANGTLQRYLINASTGEPTGSSDPMVMRVPTAQPFYTVQTRLGGSMAGTGQVSQAWSEVHQFGEWPPLIWWTSPIAPCGDYTCSEGVVAAGVTLGSLNRYCMAAWSDLSTKLLGDKYGVALTSNNSVIFIVNQISWSNPAQEGFLLGWSHGKAAGLHLADLPLATESPVQLINATARTLLARFGAWNSTALWGELPPFAYRMDIDGLGGHTYPGVIEGFNNCDSLHAVMDGCYYAVAKSVELDARARWLVVMAMPVGALSRWPRNSVNNVAAIVNDAERDVRQNFAGQRTSAIMLFAVLGLPTVLCGFLVAMWVSHDLLHLGRLIKQLSKLDFSHDTEEFAILRAGRRSCIRDVSELQDAFFRLARSIEIFARFVPESVVRNIVQGNIAALRLHVLKREVTVMFSDIRDFTSIAERLPQVDLLFVLTRYLTTMTDVIEEFAGVVTEILGDGMLAFWNTPDDVPDHATKACEAALAQQEALMELNRELARDGLPQLAARIGLHSGMVLSGNLGSETKMKFGCMGDPVNLASRLEGLCRVYGVGILCSGATQRALSPVAQLVCCRLDVVQVKGKQEATEIYEVLGSNRPETPELAVPAARIGQVQLYEQALEAWRAADFVTACSLAAAVLEERPGDVAARRLLERARRELEHHGTLSGAKLATWTGVVIMDSK